MSNQQTTHEPIWTGSVNLYWGDDSWGHKDVALFVGGLYAGIVTHHQSIHNDCDTRDLETWRAWLMTDDDGEEKGWYATEQKAKDALVDAALLELLK